jgi:hypothetical protein
MSAVQLDLQDNNSTVAPNNYRHLWGTIALVALATLCQALWTSYFISAKVGLVNVLPTLIFLTLWLSFSKFSQSKPQWQWLVFSLGFITTLRLPITISSHLQIINWGIWIVMYFCIFNSVSNYFRKDKFRSSILLITTALILFISFTHIGLNSPFTSAFRLANNLPSDFMAGKDNNQTWECTYEYREMPVHCDMRHMIASEKIFNQKDYDPSFSVFLRRFFYGYLSSLIGYPGERWIASFALNVTIWLLSCMAMYRLCELLNFKENIGAISSLCVSASWGFVSFVAQPAPYLTAYALAVILPWAAMELIHTDKDVYRMVCLTTIILAGLAVYDIYPITLVCLLLLAINQKLRWVMLIIPLQLAIVLIWQKVSLGGILGTTGDPRNSQVITNSLGGWWQALSSLTPDLVFLYTTRGLQSFLIAGFGVGAIAPFIWLAYKFLRADWYSQMFRENSDRKNAVFFILVFTVLMLLTALFFTPEAFFWTPNTGMLPRFIFYSFVANTIALASLGYSWLGKWAYLIPALTVLIACLDFTGIATVTLLFDYGDLRLIWK